MSSRCLKIVRPALRVTMLWLISVAMLGGCGFHMQKTVTLPPEMKTTYVAAKDHYSPFYLELRRGLKAADVRLVDTPTDATATVSILTDETGQRVLSVSARNVPTEYEVYYSLRYDVTAGERKVLDPQQLTLTRDYTYDETLVLGKAREGELLRDEIAKDLVRIVLKQISTQ